MGAIRLNYDIIWIGNEGNTMDGQTLSEELINTLGPDDWIELNGTRCNNLQELEQAINKAKESIESRFSSFLHGYENMMNRWNSTSNNEN